MSFFAAACPQCGFLIEVRNEGQNAALHTLCADLAKQVDWPRGSRTRIDAEAWKRLIMAAYERAHGRQADLYPSLDGHGFDVVYRRSSRVSKKEMADILEFGNAFAAENEVKRSMSKREQREYAGEPF